MNIDICPKCGTCLDNRNCSCKEKKFIAYNVSNIKRLARGVYQITASTVEMRNEDDKQNTVSMEISE